nr:RNA-directed DNA polymerase, eukaryota, reverse transcriptase zinc-binding domain protein [Tanacetum cinerariifolium]
QLLEVEAEAGYAINIADEEINLEEQAMSGSGDCLDIEEQLLEVEAEVGYAINLADEEINLEEQAMSGSGLPIGAKMTSCSNWNPLVERFLKRLSNWKAKTLSFGGRITLIRSVLGSLGVYYFSNFKAPKKIICKLEVEDSGSVIATTGPWSQIRKLKIHLNTIGINLPLLFKKKVGNRRNTSFWHDKWLGGSPLHVTYPRLYRLDLNPHCSVSDRNTSVPRVQ